jgi:Fur family ferric uptake transcriptional regulator
MNESHIIDQLREIIKKKGMKYTEQREVILKILLNYDGHLNAEELLEIVKKEYPEQNIGIATVYRALNFLEEVKLISSISFGKDGKKYESNIKNHHDHLICIKCGKIIEFCDEDIEKKQQDIAKQNSFKLTDHSMQLYGICKDCQQD